MFPSPIAEPSAASKQPVFVRHSGRLFMGKVLALSVRFVDVDLVATAPHVRPPFSGCNNEVVEGPKALHESIDTMMITRGIS